MPKKWFEIVHLLPQVLTAIIMLGTISLVSLFYGINEIAGVAAAGIIALAKDVITSDGS